MTNKGRIGCEGCIFGVTNSSRCYTCIKPKGLAKEHCTCLSRADGKNVQYIEVPTALKRNIQVVLNAVASGRNIPSKLSRGEIWNARCREYMMQLAALYILYDTPMIDSQMSEILETRVQMKIDKLLKSIGGYKSIRERARDLANALIKQGNTWVTEIQNTFSIQQDAMTIGSVKRKELLDELFADNCGDFALAPPKTNAYYYIIDSKEARRFNAHLHILWAVNMATVLINYAEIERDNICAKCNAALMYTTTVYTVERTIRWKMFLNEIHGTGMVDRTPLSNLVSRLISTIKFRYNGENNRGTAEADKV